MSKHLLAALLLASVPGAALTAAHAQTSTGTAPAATEHDRLFALFAADDEAELKRNPLSALFRGDLRYADQFGDYNTPAYFDESRKAANDALAQLATIDRAKLSPTDQIAYDVFRRANEQALIDLRPEMLALTSVRPINHFFGFHTFWPGFSSGQGGAPFNTLADYENNLKRHQGYVENLDYAIVKFREGLASGVVETKLTIGIVIEQLETQLKMPVEENPLYGPVKTFPEGISEADQARLKTEYRRMIVEEVNPVYRRLVTFLRDEYLPKAREQVGLSAMKGGDVLYARLIESTTTVPMQAEEIHRLGLSEVARITREMDAIRTKTGFKGDLKAFFDFIRTDPRFKRQTREELTQRYYAIGKIVDEKLPALFSTMPKTSLEIRPYEEWREKNEAGGSYQQGTPDGSRPGIFYFNAYDLPSRTTPGETTLYLHEGAPGHHFQISLAQENEALPAFMRFGGNTAYVEGWALYSEKLGEDMKLFDDPYQRFGHLDDEMLRAMRLVVDTGIHAKGWTREQAIRYMLDNSSMGETDATAEVERYIAIPSQALAYKIGALTIQRLRAKAERELGPKFDIRAFHDQVLNTGALPLPVLEAKIDRWIAASRG